VVGRNGGRLGGESGLMQRTVQEIAGTVAGEHAAGAVGSVGSRSEADEQYFGVDGAKSRHRFPPVVAVLVRFALRLGNTCTVFPEPGAPVAGDDLRLEPGEISLD